MKKQLALAAGLAVLAAPAFATKARLQALGEDTNGSFYINDNRNMFLNPSEVLNHKDLVTYEWGDANGVDTDADANSEGGLIRAHGNMVYGVHFGRVLDFNAGADDIEADSYNATNALDLFVAGDAGVKWGVQLTHSSQKEDENAAQGADETKTDVLDLRAGVAQGQWAAYLSYGLTGKTEHDDTDLEIERKSPLELGGSWKWDSYTAFVQYSTVKFEGDNSAEEEVETTNMQLGVGRQDKLNDKATLFTKVAYNNSKVDEETADVETKTQNLPVTIGLEYDAASWLALRGSISQSVLINNVETDGEKATDDNTTDVNAGATLKFGDLALDGVIGTEGGAGEDGTLTTDNLMTRVSMTYRF